MAYCDHWLFQYEKNCIGYRMLAEHGWQGFCVMMAAAVLLMLAAYLLRRAA